MKTVKTSKTFSALLAVAAASALLTMAGAAEAKGCIKGAVVGGVGGHVAGHHGLIGAAGGCVVGRHMANKKDKEAEAAAAAQRAPADASPHAPARQ